MSRLQDENIEAMLEVSLGLDSKGVAKFEKSLALDYLAEVSEQLLPPQETNEKHFRLLLSVLEHLRAGGDVWTSVTYFALWAVRLAGFLPEIAMRDDSRQIAQEMLLLPIAGLSPRTWTKDTASDLRQKLHRLIEQHVERHLRTAPMLESL